MKRLLARTSFLQMSAGVLLPLAVYCAAGDLDPTFGSIGKLRQPTGSTSAGNAMVNYPNGKFVVVGRAQSGEDDFLTTRYNADGSPDATFNGNGVVLTRIFGSSIATAVRVQNDGKIVVAGFDNGQFAVVRYDQGGSLDRSFGGDGIVTTMLDDNSCSAAALAIQGDGKIVVAGHCFSADFALVRYNPNGSIDTSFGGGDGIAYTVINGLNEPHAIIVQLDSKILVAGGNAVFTLTRYNTNGSPDTSFDGDGIVTVDFGTTSSSARTVNELISDFAPTKIVAAGGTGADFAIARFTSNGALDTTLDGDGKLITPMTSGNDYITGISFTDFPARITVGGTAGSGFGIARYTLGGVLDTTFNGSGKVTVIFPMSLNGVANAMIAPGMITLGGYLNSTNGTSLALVQFNPNGTINPAFGDGGLRSETGIGSTGTAAEGVAIQADGRIVVASSTGLGPGGHFLIQRFNPDSSLDTTFNGAGTTEISIGTVLDVPAAIAIQPDGKVVVAGYSVSSQSSDFPLLRLNTDGTLDTSFDGDGKLVTSIVPGDDRASAVAIQTDGKIVAGGYAVSGNSDVAIVRYNTNGSLDTSFENDGIVILSSNRAETASGLAIQPDGKIVVAGTSDNSVSKGQDIMVARLGSNGLLDTSFDGDGLTRTAVNRYNLTGAVLLQSDGKIVVTGTTYVALVDSVFIAVRYNPDGSPDTSFDADGIVTRQVGPSPNSCHAAAVQADGKIVLAGYADNTFAVSRFNANGSIDNSYGTGGTRLIEYSDNEPNIVNGIAVDASGRVVIAGDAGGMIGLARLESASAARAPFDFDGDGKSDVSVYRPSSGLWYLDRSQAGGFVLQLGNATDKIAPADFDGDGKTDIAVYRPSQGVWYLYNSAASTYTTTPFGIAEDLPAPGDYDGDGRADLAIYRPSTGTWWISRTTQGLIAIQFGALGDVPVTGDYDGDGKSDLVVYRPSNGVWYERRSAAGDFAIQFGNSTDKIAPADYDGDGKTDVAVYRPSQTTWYIVNSSNGGYPVFVFGLSTDVPTPGDYDGDGKADVAIFRPSNGQWWLNRTTSGLTVTQFGITGDKPTPNAFGN